jgi:hypothetical protein
LSCCNWRSVRSGRLSGVAGAWSRESRSLSGITCGEWGLCGVASGEWRLRGETWSLRRREWMLRRIT